MEKKKQEILITGSAGFIGFHLSKRLLEMGYSILGVDNVNDYYDPQLKYSRLRILQAYPGFRFVKGDISDPQVVGSLFSGDVAPLVIHLAAQAGVRYSIENPQAYMDSNITGFFNILEACRHQGTQHLLYASSSSVYGNQEKVPFSTEDDVSKPISLYAATKKANELMAYTYSHLYGFATTGLRFFTVYGPYGRPDMAYFSFTNKIMQGQPIQVFNQGDMYRDFTYIDDIVQGIVSIAEKPLGKGVERARVYNIGNHTPVKVSRFIEILEEALGQTAQKEFLPMQDGDVYQTYADIAPLERDYGFRPSTPLEEGLGRFVAWYREEYQGAK